MITVTILQNSPDLWRSVFPKPQSTDHKYDRGHAVIFGSDNYTGATRLAAEACSRIGSGLVTVLTTTQAQIYRQTLPADIMVRDGTLDGVNRPATLLAGPGGCNQAAAQDLSVSSPDLSLVLDADAIRLCSEVAHARKIITPHEGEYERYIGPLSGDRTETARDASRETRSVIVLKGPQTIIAAPDGRVCMNTTASPYLAKAGTGDVLAGMITGLVAQGMPDFDASCSAVWLHGEASVRIGPGLVPQDLIAALPALMGEILS